MFGLGAVSRSALPAEHRGLRHENLLPVAAPLPAGMPMALWSLGSERLSVARFSPAMVVQALMVLLAGERRERPPLGLLIVISFFNRALS